MDIQPPIYDSAPKKKASFFYFIGRLNPPHNGHIKALEILVQMANSQDSVPLILLGSGPGGISTMDNPIPFELKKQFISRVLNEKLPGSKYVIQEMKNPSQNVSQYIRQNLELRDELSNITDIQITHIAGGKDEDATKLGFVLKSAASTARSIIPEAIIITNVATIDVATIDGETPMSATQVRKDAYKSFLEDETADGRETQLGFEKWMKKYGEFYGQDSKNIYDAILKTLTNIPKEEQISSIQEYLMYGTLPQGSVTKSAAPTRKIPPISRKTPDVTISRKKRRDPKKNLSEENLSEEDISEEDKPADYKRRRGGTKRKHRRNSNKIQYKKRRATRRKYK